MNREHSHRFDLAATAVLLAFTLIGSAALRADDEDAPAVDEPDGQPIVKVITLESPLNDATFGRVQNTALKLHNQSRQEDRDAYMFLEVTPGDSPMHQVLGLAKFLVSSDIARVKTIAWVPETVTGHNAVLPLACREIVMHPDAELGDIGRGEAVDDIDRQAIVAIAENRHNRKVSPALARGMCDPTRTVLRVAITEGEQTRTEVVTAEEFDRLRKTTKGRIESNTISEEGDPLKLSGRRARDLDVLVVATAEGRAELAGVYAVPPLREDVTEGEEIKVSVIRVQGVIDQGQEAFLERQIDRAVASGSNMIVFEVNSPGGLLVSSYNLAIRIADLEEKDVRTIAYIPGGADHVGAISGAAIVSLGCDEIYMEPDARIGDAGPIEMRPGQAFERAPEKVLSPLVDMMRELAEKKNRPSALAMAMANKDLEVFRVKHVEDGRIWFMTEDQIAKEGGVWVKDGANALVPESAKNLLLTLNGKRAHELKIAEPPVANFDELKNERLGVGEDVKIVMAKRNWVDDVIFVLCSPAAMFLLVVLGFVLAFIELHTMTGIFALGSGLCFALFFWSRYLGGTAGALEMILFGVGLLCILLEAFVIPGFGVFGIAGGLLMFTSIVMAAQTFDALDSAENFRQLSYTIGTLGASVVTVAIIGMVASRFLPQVPMFNKLILTPPGYEETPQPKLRPDLVGDPMGLGVGVGDDGLAETTLRPAGKATINGRYIDVVSDGPYIDEGTSITVVDVAGNRIVVREA